MGIFRRFADIVEANINALIDKAEDPAKMVDQYLRQAQEDLAEVKVETSGVIAEVNRAKRELDSNSAEIDRYTDLAKKALQSGNEGDAKQFLAKKQELEVTGQTLKAAYDVAHTNAAKMRQLYEKLTNDIKTLEGKREQIKAKMALAETQEKVNKLGSSADNFNSTMGAMRRMEDKANKMLDMANASAELDAAVEDDISSIASKYEGANTKSVDDELAALKAELNL